MKYNPASKTLEFASDEAVTAFHDQLTELMRSAMGGVGDAQTGDAEAARLTQAFFEQYSALADALRRLRAHLPRREI